MKLNLIKTLSGLKLAYDTDHDNYKKLPLNEVFEVDYVKRRNGAFHRKFMALINLCYQNQDKYNNFEHLRKWLTICSGHYELVFNLDTGEMVKEALSIKFSNMDEIEFNKLYSDVLQVICDKFLFDKEDVLNNVQQYF
jgi:hypothetical protein